MHTAFHCINIYYKGGNTPTVCNILDSTPRKKKFKSSSDWNGSEGTEGRKNSSLILPEPRNQIDSNYFLMNLSICEFFLTAS
jgi:hypothetical protein